MTICQLVFSRLSHRYLCFNSTSDAEVETLLSSRIAPDMFPLSTQIRFACVQVYEAVFRLQGEASPEIINELIAEGRNAGEQPGTFSDAKARIDEAIALLGSLSPDALNENPDKLIVHELPDGMTFDMTPEQYARDWSLAQFYFHIMTAYTILRSEKIQLGKADYVSHMFAYLRPGTMPES